MSDPGTVTATLLFLLPLGLAAGVDLYLTLLLLGAAAQIGWAAPLPGELVGLGSPWALSLAGILYLIEVVFERRSVTGVFWNLLQLLVRPVAAGLLAVLALAGEPVLFQSGVAIAVGLVALRAHLIRTGTRMLSWVTESRAPSSLLTTLGEDTLTVGLVTLALDWPRVGATVGAIALLAALFSAGLPIRAARFSFRLARARTFGSLGSSGWTRPEAMPTWVSPPPEGSSEAVGRPLRGTTAALVFSERAGPLRTGWLVVERNHPAFWFLNRGQAQRIELLPTAVESVRRDALTNRVTFKIDSGLGCLLIPKGGPGIDAVRGAFSA